MRNIRKLLQLCHKTWSTEKLKRHNCTIDNDGEIVLTIFRDDRFESFFFRETDLGKKPDVVHCKKSGQQQNGAHKHADFSLKKVCDILKKIGNTKVIYEKDNVEIYSWDLVVEKVR